MTSFDDRISERRAREKRLRRRVNAAILGIALTGALVVGGVLAVTGEGSEKPRQAAAGDTAAPAAPSLVAPISAKRELEFERGLSAAVAHVIATIQDPAEGTPHAEFILQQFQALTDCSVVDVSISTSKTRRAGEGLATFRVEYAKPDWHDQFVSVTVRVDCG